MAETIRDVVVKIRLEQVDTKLKAPDTDAIKKAVQEYAKTTQETNRKVAESYRKSREEVATLRKQVEELTKKIEEQGQASEESSKKTTESNMKVSESFQAIGEGALVAGRGVALLSVNSENLAGAMEKVAKAQGVFDIFKGTTQILSKLPPQLQVVVALSAAVGGLVAAFKSWRDIAPKAIDESADAMRRLDFMTKRVNSDLTKQIDLMTKRRDITRQAEDEVLDLLPPAEREQALRDRRFALQRQLRRDEFAAQRQEVRAGREAQIRGTRALGLANIAQTGIDEDVQRASRGATGAFSFARTMFRMLPFMDRGPSEEDIFGRLGRPVRPADADRTGERRAITAQRIENTSALVRTEKELLRIRQQELQDRKTVIEKQIADQERANSAAQRASERVEELSPRNRLAFQQGVRFRGLARAIQDAETLRQQQGSIGDLQMALEDLRISSEGSLSATVDEVRKLTEQNREAQRRILDLESATEVSR